MTNYLFDATAWITFLAVLVVGLPYLMTKLMDFHSRKVAEENEARALRTEAWYKRFNPDDLPF